MPDATDARAASDTELDDATALESRRDAPIGPPTVPAQPPYSWQNSDIHIVAKLLRDSGDPRGRAVVVGVKNDDDVPLIHLFWLPNPVFGDLVAPLQTLLDDLVADLPQRWTARCARAAEAAAKRSAVPPAKSAQRATAKTGKKPAPSTPTLTATRPVPPANVSAKPARPAPPADPFDPAGATQTSIFDLF